MGLAIGDYHPEKNGFSYTVALKALVRKKPHHDLESIREIISQYGIQKIIIGYPLNMDGTDSAMSTKILAFGDRLKKNTGLQPEYVDERLTSFEAGEMLKDLLPDRRKRKQKLDSTAALVILNNYPEKK